MLGVIINIQFKGGSTMRVLGARVIVKEEKNTEKQGSIIIPGKENEPTFVGKIIDVGPGAIFDGHRMPMQVSVGDRVVYTAYSGTPIITGNKEKETLIILNERDILAVLDENE